MYLSKREQVKVEIRGRVQGERGAQARSGRRRGRVGRRMGRVTDQPLIWLE
jgi:hypothetical protein